MKEPLENKPLQIDLLGGFRMTFRGKQITALTSARPQELLAYLIIHRSSPQQRSRIAMQLWPDSPEKQTRANLRQLLYQLRSGMPEPDTFILAETATLQWNSDAPARIDMIDFEHALAEADQAAEAGNHESEIDARKSAEACYGGPLLPHCMEEWITGSRRRLEEKHLSSLKRLVDLYELRRDYDRAIEYASRIRELDPLDETATRMLMRLYALSDDRAAAVRTYQQLERKMQHELQITPGFKTRELFERLNESFTETTPNGNPGKKRSHTTTPATGEWPTVGRQAEWEQLIDAWNLALQGQMQCVLIRGEPGIGSTRLARDMIDRLARQGYAGASATCHEEQNTPGYAPAADWIRSAPFRARAKRLEPPWRSEIVRLVPELDDRAGDNDKDSPDDSAVTPEAPPWQQRRFEEALSRALLTGGNAAALLLDGLQWCDSETLGWLSSLQNRPGPVPLLLITTLSEHGSNQPEDNRSIGSFIISFRRNRCLHEITLGPLSRNETASLASNVLNRDLSSSMEQLIYSETEGNPLFTVEMAREIHLLEELNEKKNGDGFVSPDATRSQIRSLPKLMTDLIGRRFSYLSKHARELLSIMAVAGRDFSFDLIAACSGLDEGKLMDLIEELIDHRILMETCDGRFDFRHDKLREVAYKKLSELRRRKIHLLLADQMERLAEGDPEQRHRKLAFHFERADAPSQALRHYLASARHAREQSGRQDPGMLRRAIELLPSMHPSRDRDRYELELVTALAHSLLQQQSFDGKEIFRLCKRANQLTQTLGEPPVVEILAILGSGTLRAGDPAVAAEIGEALYSLNDLSGDIPHRTEACYLLGMSNRITGNMERSVEWFQTALLEYEQTEPFPLTHLQGYELDGRALIRMEAVITYLLAGNSSEGHLLLDDTIKRIHRSGREADIACCRFYHAWIQTLLRNIPEARGSVKRFFESGFEPESLQWTVQAEIIQGWTTAVATSPISGTDQMWEGLELLEGSGTLIVAPYYYGLLAELLVEMREFKNAREALSKAWDIVSQTGARLEVPELHRIEGKLALAQAPEHPGSARSHFELSIKEAGESGTILYKNRASDALAELDGPDNCQP